VFHGNRKYWQPGKYWCLWLILYKQMVVENKHETQSYRVRDSCTKA
jgi:hypothetical protein